MKKMKKDLKKKKKGLTVINVLELTGYSSVSFNVKKRK